MSDQVTLTITGQWTQPFDWADSWRMRIAGYTAYVYDRGDVWAWELTRLDDSATWDGWVDSEDEAKAAVVAQLRKLEES